METPLHISLSLSLLLFQAHNDPDLFVSSVGFNYSDFVWAVSCIMSRQNKIPSKETSEPVLVLIPFWDMANHSPGKVNNKSYFYRKIRVVMSIYDL